MYDPLSRCAIDNFNSVNASTSDIDFSPSGWARKHASEELFINECVFLHVSSFCRVPMYEFITGTSSVWF
jgi:hypothetical protein